jgi:hypothetical protein
MMKTSGTTILDGLHGELAEERARRGRRAGRQERNHEDDPPNPRGKSRLDALWNGRDNK